MYSLSLSKNVSIVMKKMIGFKEVWELTKVKFYHAGCAVCVDAEQMVLNYLDRTKVDVEVVHLGQDRSRIEEAEQLGVKSVPALVVNNQVFHINFGASMESVKNS